MNKVIDYRVTCEDTGLNENMVEIRGWTDHAATRAVKRHEANQCEYASNQRDGVVVTVSWSEDGCDYEEKIRVISHQELAYNAMKIS